MEKVIEAEDYLKKINVKYFDEKSLALEYIQITFKQDKKNIKIKIGDDEIKISVTKDSHYYINPKKYNKKVKSLDKNGREIEIKRENKILYNIYDIFSKSELENYKNKLKSITKKSPKDITNLKLYSDGKQIDENKEKLKNLLEKLKDITNKSSRIINKKKKSKEDIFKIIEMIRKVFNDLKSLEFKNPKYNNGIGEPTRTNKFCEKFKNEFRDMVIGKMEALIKFYDDFNQKKKEIKKNAESFDDSFSLFRFENKRPKIIDLKIDKSKSFQINYSYVALLLDSGKEKLQFGHSDYNLKIGPIITCFYSGTKLNYNIVSFVNDVLLVKLIFNKEELDDDSIMLIQSFNIKPEFAPTEPISIIFTVPESSTKKEYKLRGHLEIKTKDVKIEPLLVEFEFNVILLPLEIYLISKNGNELFWNKDRLCFKKNSFIEKENIEIQYIIRNFNKSDYFLGNYCLKNLDKNEVEEEPTITQNDKGRDLINIKLPKISGEKQFLHGLFKLYFTNKMSIPIEFKAYIKKPLFKVYYYDELFNTIIEENAKIYIYKHQYKKVKYIKKILHFRVKLYDEYSHIFSTSSGTSPKYDISFYLNGKESDAIKKEIKEGLNFDLIINKIKEKEDINVKLKFILDENEKNFYIKILFEKENTKENINRFLNFPYKLIKNGRSYFAKDYYKDINYNNKNYYGIFYSPFCEKIIPDKEILECENINFGSTIGNFEFIKILDEFNNYWVPNFKIIETTKDSEKEQIEKMDGKYIKEAKDGISKIFNEIYFSDKFFSFFSRNYTYDEINKKEINPKMKNFLDFICWLISNKEKLVNKIQKLKNLFEKMGDNLLKKFSPYLKDNYKDEDDICSIIYYNIIIKFWKILIERYKILKENNFNLSKILKKNKEVNEKNRFFCFPPFNQEEFNKKVNEKKLMKEDDKEIIAKSSDKWLFFENEVDPEIIDDEQIKKFDEYYNDNKKVEGKNIEINMNIISIIDLSKENSLKKIIFALKNGFQICKSFMFCIGKMDKDKINETFNHLYEIYKQTKNSTRSILSNEIIMFKDAFENLCLSLVNSGTNLSKFDALPKLTNKKEKILIEKLRPISYIFPRGISWNKKRSEFYQNDLRVDEDNEIKLEIEENLTVSPPLQIKNKQDSPNPKKIEEIQRMKETNSEMNEVLGKGVDYNKFDSEDEEDQDKFSVDDSDKPLFKFKDSVKKAEDKEVNKLKSISDENSIQNMIKKMINKSSVANIKIPVFDDKKNKQNIFERRKNRKEGEDYVTKPLYEIFNNLSKNLYLKLFQQCIHINRNELCAVIAIDISRNIDKKSKLYHTIIATAMAQCFNSIEIPYSIVVFCDYGVQLVIKDFEEPHSKEISQLIFDAIMAKRFSTRIFDVCCYISEFVKCKNRTNKRIFIISNGLDNKLKIGEKWLPIFGNDKERFCFYFVLPHICNDIEKKEIIKIWEDFKEKTKIDIAIINIEDILKGASSTYQDFQKVMQYKIISDDKIIKKNKKIQPDFKDVIKFDREKFENLLSSINNEIMAKQSNIYFVQNKNHIPSKIKRQIEDFPIKNPFSVFKCECSDEIQKSLQNQY